MSRLPVMSLDQMSSDQKALYERIAGKRGAVRGPFNTWLYSPKLCDRVEALGQYVRFDFDLSLRIKEFVVLVIARHWDSHYMWTQHAPISVKEGTPASVIKAIADRKEPQLETKDERVLYDYTNEILKNHVVSKKTFDAAVELLGPQRVVELTAFIGNYSMVSMVLNAFEVDIPDGKPSTLPA